MRDQLAIKDRVNFFFFSFSLFYEISITRRRLPFEICAFVRMASPPKDLNTKRGLLIAPLVDSRLNFKVAESLSANQLKFMFILEIRYFYR